MKMKRFFGPDMRSVIQQVRDSQGPDAVILSNRRVDGGIEVVAAIDYDEDVVVQAAYREGPAYMQPSRREEPVPDDKRDDRQPTLASLLRKPFADRGAASATASKAQVSHDMTQTENVGSSPLHSFAAAASQARITEQSAMDEYAQKPERYRQSEQVHMPELPNVVGQVKVAEQPRSVEPPKAVWTEDPGVSAMRRELQSMRDMLEQQLTQLTWQETVRRHPLHATALHELMSIGIAPDIARNLVQQLPASMLDAEDARVRVLSLLAQSLPAATSDLLDQGGMIALLGTTGVGKTTTLAKLAARFALRHGASSVALVSTDGYRIGAHEQLRMFGRLLGVTVHIVADPLELMRTLQALADVPLVLIDSAGMSPRDGRMADQYALFTQVRDRVKPYLVLPAPNQLETLEETVRSFANMQLAGAVITKTDESTHLGNALSVAMRHRLPVAYLSDGQRVPEDLHRALVPDLLARAVTLGRRRREEQMNHANEAIAKP